MKKIMNIMWCLLVILLVGCVETSEPNTKVVEEDKGDKVEEVLVGIIESDNNGEIYRFIDDEYKVVCWVYTDWISTGGAAGISCIPINQTG